MPYTHKSGTVVAFKGLPTTSPPTPLLNRFTSHVTRAKTPSEILDGLDDFASKLLPINVLGVGRMPQRTTDWRSIQLGRDVFLHSSAPVEWWNEYSAKAAHGYDPGIMMAKSSLVAYTWTETMQMLDPIGFERWPYELALKYGHPRCADLLRRPAVAGGLLVAAGAGQRTDAPAADASDCGRRVCGVAARAGAGRGFQARRNPSSHNGSRASPSCGWSRSGWQATRSPSSSASERRPCAAT